MTDGDDGLTIVSVEQIPIDEVLDGVIVSVELVETWEHEQIGLEVRVLSSEEEDFPVGVFILSD